MGDSGNGVNIGGGAMSMDMPGKTEYDKKLYARLKVAVPKLKKSLDVAPDSIKKTFETRMTFGKGTTFSVMGEHFVKNGTEMQSTLAAMAMGPGIFKEYPDDWDLQITESVEKMVSVLEYINKLVDECAKVKVELDNVNLSTKDNITVDFTPKGTNIDQISAEIFVDNPTIGVGVYGSAWGVEMETVDNTPKALAEFVRQEINNNKKVSNFDNDTW